jgi:hypothetical protein
MSDLPTPPATPPASPSAARRVSPGAVVAIGLGVVILVLAAILLLGGDDDTDVESSDPAGGEGSVSVFDLEVGHCFDDPDGLDAEPSVVESLETVDCDTPHDNEIFFVYDHPGDGDYPGVEAVLEVGSTQCVEQLGTYVGGTAEESDLVAEAVLYPNETSWRGVDREIVCALYASDLGKLTRSMRDTQG